MGVLGLAQSHTRKEETFGQHLYHQSDETKMKS
jgi:hypothetical protein